MPTEPARYRALPDEDYRFTLGLSRGTIADYFAPTAESAELLQERQSWLAAEPANFFGLLPVGSDIADEFCQFVTPWVGGVLPTSTLGDSVDSTTFLRQVCSQLEPDIVLLQMGGDQHARAVGGCVCFPSAWSLPEKLGLDVSQIHSVVPGLNDALATRIDRLLAALKPGEGWLRSNWGAATTSERNQHPTRNLPRWTLPLLEENVWLRREHQILFRLPRTGGIVFGIRLELTSLTEVLRDQEMSRRWARGLRTMSPELLRYKNVLEIRDSLLQILGEVEGARVGGD